MQVRSAGGHERLPWHHFGLSAAWAKVGWFMFFFVLGRMVVWFVCLVSWLGLTWQNCWVGLFGGLFGACRVFFNVFSLQYGLRSDLCVMCMVFGVFQFAP